MVYNLKGKDLILSQRGCFLPGLRNLTGPERLHNVLEEIHFIQRSVTEAPALKRFSLTLHHWQGELPLGPRRGALSREGVFRVCVGRGGHPGGGAPPVLLT